MPSGRNRKNEDRIFVRDGRRTYRRSYSMVEVRYGAGVLAVLALIFAWVAWKGAHPDPEIFAANIGVLNPGTAPADRGPLPDDLAPEGWVEGTVAQYDTSNLYVKIDGREDYYRGFGFQRLYFVSLGHEGDASTVVDIELFDMGKAANALGAYAGERPPGVVPEVDEHGMAHTARNALFLTRGRYYARAIGSDESPEVLDLLAKIRGRLEAGIEGEPLPWGYALFAGALGVDPGDIDYMKENAFSFGFASHVYAAPIGDGDAQMFVTPAAGAGEAGDLAAKFTDGFLSYGEKADETGGVTWVRDRYINTLAGCEPAGAWVVGVRGAEDLDAARAGLARLSEAVGSLSDDTHAVALAAKQADAEGGGEDEEGGGVGGGDAYGAEESYGADEELYGGEGSYAGDAGEGGSIEH